MSNRSLTSAIRLSRCCNGRGTTSLGVSPRQFSTSPAHGLRAVFTETENSELNKVLSTIQEKIILPAYLPDKQRKMVFDPKMKTKLEQNPVIIEVDGLEHKFSSINRFKEIDNSKIILVKALNNMKDRDDWNNLGTLLAGYKKAGIKLKANTWGRIARMAGKNGSIYAVIECAKQADKTGLLLTSRETVVRVLSFINEKITNSNREEGETKQAQKWAELVIDLLQRPEHTVQSLPTRERLHLSRMVRGMTLFTRTSAVKVKQSAGEDVTKDVALLKDEAEFLNTLWKDTVKENLTEAEDFAKLNPTVERNSSPKGVKVPKALNGSAYVQVLAQNIKGIALAREILGDGDIQSLASAEVALSNHLREFVQTSFSSTEGWAQEYETVVGHAPKW